MLKFEFICDICTTTWGERWILEIMLLKLWEKVGEKKETIWSDGGEKKSNFDNTITEIATTQFLCMYSIAQLAEKKER